MRLLWQGLAAPEDTDKVCKLAHCHTAVPRAPQLLSCPASKRRAAARTEFLPEAEFLPTSLGLAEMSGSVRHLEDWKKTQVTNV